MKNLDVTCLAMSLIALSPMSGIAAPTGGSVSVYGAVGDGSTDDTTAFNQCIANNAVCWVDPAKTYAVGHVQMANGKSLIGLGVTEYGAETASTTASRPVLVLNGVSGVTDVIDVSKVTDGGAIQGLFIDCRGSTSANGISGGSFELSIAETTVVSCNNGLGGSSYNGGAHITNSTFGGNLTGISGIVDSLLVNVDFSNNSGDGLYLGTGANANSIINCRFEFNQGFGLETYGGTNSNNVSNSFFDHNYKAGLRLVGSTSFTISNSSFNRNGRNNTGPDQNAQIYLSSASNASIVGGSSLVGQDDGGTGAFSPAYLLSFDTGTASSHVTIAGLATSGLFSSNSNKAGSYTVAPIEGNEPAVGYDVSGVFDIPNTASTTTGLVAASAGGQANATQLPTSIDTVSTVSAANASVKLAACAVGRQQTVANAGANPMQVYGSGTDTINGVASGTGVSQAAGKVASYVCTAAGKWSRLLSD